MFAYTFFLTLPKLPPFCFYFSTGRRGTPSPKILSLKKMASNIFVSREDFPPKPRSITTPSRKTRLSPKDKTFLLKRKFLTAGQEILTKDNTLCLYIWLWILSKIMFYHTLQSALKNIIAILQEIQQYFHGRKNISETRRTKFQS